MMVSLDDYESIADRREIKEIRTLAARLRGKHIVMISSTPSGGGVAEILNRLVLLMNTLGVQVGWRILKGSDNFFQVTKELHNALQGGEMILSERKKRLYEETNKVNALTTHISDHDLVVVHDPQPLALIKYYKKHIPWIWRMHIDLSRPNKAVLKYLKPYVEKYDAMIVSSPTFRRSDINTTTVVLPPAIDPLSIKNAPLTDNVRRRMLKACKIKPEGPPIIAQISRFDRWKDPLGVIEVFEQVRKKINCRLVLMGNMAIDDPEGPSLLAQVQRRAAANPDITIVVNPPDNDRAVNALQQSTAIVLQKSIREGFALTVSEAMWKGTPVIGSKVGGIPLQVVHKKTGYLISSNDEAVAACLQLLQHTNLRKKMSTAAHEHVRKNFLITRQLRDYFRLFDFFLNRSQHFHVRKKYPYSEWE